MKCGSCILFDKVYSDSNSVGKLHLSFPRLLCWDSRGIKWSMCSRSSGRHGAMLTGREGGINVFISECHCSIATCLTRRWGAWNHKRVSDAAINAVIQHFEERWHPRHHSSLSVCADATRWWHWGDRSITLHPQPVLTSCVAFLLLFLLNYNNAIIGF